MRDRGICPDCGTSPRRGSLDNPRRMCGWPCGSFGFYQLLRSVQTRVHYFARNRPRWWGMVKGWSRDRARNRNRS